jgi:hypothetical protein
MILSIIILSIMILRIMIFCTMILSIMILSIMIISIMTLSRQIHGVGKQHKITCITKNLHNLLENVLMMSVIM